MNNDGSTYKKEINKRRTAMNIINILYYLSLNENIMCKGEMYYIWWKKNSILLQEIIDLDTINCYIDEELQRGN